MNPTIGATYLGGSQCQFVVWAPLAESVDVRIINSGAVPLSTNEVKSWREHTGDRLARLQRTDRDYHRGIVDGVESGALYIYCLGGKKSRPDPASFFQPQGVHGPSQVVDPRAFPWKDVSWRGISSDDQIVYEVHVGTYTPEGSFDAMIPHLAEIKALGVTMLELMPVAQFPGGRNWGYDGVYPFAVQNSYGGPEGLRRLVNTCHECQLAVVLDVVYNHLGPEGNYLADFGPYFTDRYRSPWGQAINFDGPHSDEVVRYFIENALYWFRDFHIDALRLDAIHGIVDRNAQPFLQLLSQSVHEFARGSARQVHLIAESDLNDVRYIQPADSGGYGLDAQWSDDFHHSLHTLLTREQSGYYMDFGRLQHLKKALEEGFVYSGQYSAYRRQRHGNSSRNIPAQQFVVFDQNHDQVGNRLFGDRLSTLVCFEALKLAAGIVILSPFIPLLFMGEEWGEPAPFQYFTSHSDATLIEAVRRGRREEFAAFNWHGEPPDPQDEGTFLRCKLDHRLRDTEPHRTLLEFYRELIQLRKTLPAFQQPNKKNLEVHSSEEARIIQIRRWTGIRQRPSTHGRASFLGERAEVLILVNFSDESRVVSPAVRAGDWHKVLDSADLRWRGPGSSIPASFDSSEGEQLALCPKSLSVFQRSG